MTRRYLLWRRRHLAASGVVGLIALVHSALTWRFFAVWTPDAVWFLGTGLGLCPALSSSVRLR